jgi:hypothetical protein
VADFGRFFGLLDVVLGGIVQRWNYLVHDGATLAYVCRLHEDSATVRPTIKEKSGMRELWVLPKLREAEQ